MSVGKREETHEAETDRIERGIIEIIKREEGIETAEKIEIIGVIGIERIVERWREIVERKETDGNVVTLLTE